MYVKVAGYKGVAWSIVDKAEEPWSLVMVGDDQVFKFDPEECEEIDEDFFCQSCGQTGCGHR